MRGAMVALAIAVAGMLATGQAVARADVPNSADRMTMWMGCSELATLTDAELNTWKSRGVDGFVCMSRWLHGMGGSENFTGNLNADLSSTQYSLQRQLRDSAIIGRLKARGMKAYLGTYLVNYFNKATPLRDWFDDAGWSGAVLPAMGNLAAAAKSLGFAGVAFDQELYPQHGGAKTATWDWNYPGNQRSQQTVRAKARQRGGQLMRRILDAFPHAELVAYDVQFPDTWGEVIQKEVNGYANVYANRLDIDFWDGLTSVEGYDGIRLFDATFYKTPHIGTWDSALHYHYNRLYSYLSKRLSNWTYAASRFHVSPFAWIGPGPCGCAFEAPRPPDYVARQLLAFRKWGTGGEFANYAYGRLRSFDYSPYASAMSPASTPATVDTQAPALGVAAADPARTANASTRLHGTSGDNLAVRLVRWVSDRGHQGVARASWQVKSGDARSGYSGETSWEIPDIPLEPGDNKITITAEDIKGLTRSAAVTVHRTTGSRPTPSETKQSHSAEPQRAAKRRRAAARRARRAARFQARRRCVRRARARHSGTARRVAVRRCKRRSAASPRQRCLRRVRARHSGTARRVGVRRCKRRSAASRRR